MSAGTCRNEHIQDANVHKGTQNQVSALSTQDKLLLSSWGLPEKIQHFYERKGITHMFSWQLECLTVGKVLEGGNLVYSAPTSAGKTLVAEILMAQTIFERQKKVILILPFVSVVREKMFYFQNLFSLNGIRVEGFMGGHSPSAGFKQVNMAVCTIEKANSIINRLLEEKDLNSLGLVVVDELHLLGDQYRGYLLELLLTKLKYVSSKFEINIQIVGMSATLPNLKVLADWLNADLYFTSFRPVPLSETLKCGNNIYDKELNKLSEIVPLQSDVPDCADNIGQLCLETIQNGHSVLIFCPSKSWCGNLADEIALFFKRLACSKSSVVEGSPGWIIRNQISLEKLTQVIEHLKMTPVGVDPDLQRTVSCGVAFHHAGLTLDERDIIEGSFRNGSIRVLCATSTLSSGVNLPARRVIIRTPMAFGSVMDILTYRQMIGRAGRMGVDSEGESILICKTNEKIVCQQLMSSHLKPIESCLGRGTLSASLKRALLEIIASGIACTPEEVRRYTNCTFLASNPKLNIENPINSCIKFLEENEFIRLQENGTIYVATPLGQACLASSLPPDEGLTLFRELQRARRCFVLDTDLHIIYQVTPYSVSEQWTKLDWLHVLYVLENMPESMKRVGELVGVEESFLVRIAKGTLNPNTVENRIKLSIHRRFYTALALQDLVNEIPLTEVSEKYQCNKGTLQSLQQSAATYAGMVTEFTKKLGWGSIELIFSQFQERLQFGVERDLCELMRLPLLNVIRARALFNAGYKSLVAIANGNASDLENVLYSSIPFQTMKDIAGETSFERVERNKLQTIWITGNADLSVRRAAEILIDQARNALELEMGVEEARWGNRVQNSQIMNQLNHSQMSSKTMISAVSKCTDVLEEQNQTKKISDKSIVISTPCNAIAENIISGHIEQIPQLSTPKQGNHSIFISTPTEKNMESNFSNLSEVIIESKFNSTEISKRNETDYFASSFNVDNIMNFTEVVKKFDKVPEENARICEVDESDLSSMYSNSPICEKPDTAGLGRLSGDMFVLQEIEANCEALPSPNPNEDDDNESKTLEGPADLFSESLTFDTQMERVLDIDEEVKPEVKPNTSFHSDDLGFVSDFSPPKQNQTKKKGALKNEKTQRSSATMKDLNWSTPKNISTPISSTYKEGDVLSKSHGQSLKRKNCITNSPDFIIGSDDSYVEDGHVSKKAKVLNAENNQVFTESEVHDESDTEILPTPKCNKTIIMKNKNNISSKSIINYKGSLLNNTVVLDRRSITEQDIARRKINSCLEKPNPEISSNLQRNSTICDESKTVTGNLSNISAKPNWDKICIIEVSAEDDVFESFREEMKLQNIIGLALGCRRIVRERKSSIGLKIMKKKPEKPKDTVTTLQYKDMVLEGIAVYYKGNIVFYLSFEGGNVNFSKKIALLRDLSGQKKLFRLFDAKEQIKLLHHFTSVFLEGSYEDPKTAHWLLSKTWREKGYSSIIAEHIPEATKLTSQLGPLLGFSGPGIYAKSSVMAKTRACHEAFLSFHVMERQLRLLQGKLLLELFQQVEMPLILGLAEMELVGFQFDIDKLIEIKKRLDSVQSELCEKAYSFAQYKFSLASAAAVSKVLYNDLKLGKSDSTRRQRPSTSKEALQELAIETNHPLPDIILDWRKIQSVITKVLSPLLQMETEIPRLYSVTQTYTTTGRLAMQEPNLQNMPRNFCISFGNDDPDISIREIFTASDGCSLLSVDYCQIELRILAHLSNDQLLIDCITESADVFVNIAANIYGISESNVDDDLRQRAKKTCYGIIYGIGARSLSHQLRVEESVASALMEDFKNRYKGVRLYLENTLKDCRKKGYVTSLLGRRRYLPYIKDPNPAIKSEAERQAINTTIQGSAADLLKVSMVKIRQKIKALNEENLTVNLLLHLHDELLFEVSHGHTETVAVILKETMENVLDLKVATPVKLHVGPTWGQLRLYEI